MENELDELLREAMETWNTKQANPYVVSLIDVLLPCGQRGMLRARAIDLIERSRRAKRLHVPSRFEEVVQSAFNQHCETSSVHRKRNRPEDGLFRSRRDGTHAVWTVIPDRADAWVRAHKQPTSEVAETRDKFDAATGSRLARLGASR